MWGNENMIKSILSPKTEIREKSLNGKGTFAIQDIKKGEMIYIRGGQLMRMEEHIIMFLENALMEFGL